MNSITFALLLVVLGCACAQLTDHKQQVLAAMERAGISETLRDMDEECRGITKDFLSSCIAELYPDYTLAQIEYYLFRTNILDDFALNFEEFSLGIAYINLYPDRTLVRNGGMCQAHCQISKHACTCGDGNVEGWGRVFTNGGPSYLHFDFLFTMQELCQRENIDFDLSVRDDFWGSCDEDDDEWYYSNIDCS